MATTKKQSSRRSAGGRAGAGRSGAKATGSRARSGGQARRSRSGSGAGGGNKRLVVVESPAKAKTINRYLGSDYIVKASMGHVRDLPKRNEKGQDQPVPGVDLEHDFAPTYQPLPRSRKVLTELRKHAKDAPEVFLATDLDREGEAIAWHVAEGLNVPADRIRRVVFNQITSAAVREAFRHPRDIDMSKVNAQQARRILDRIVGYQISPLLWRKVAGGLSAGRVQSVAVRLIVERERDIEAFVPEEYWRIEGVFTTDLAAADELGERWRQFLARRDEKGRGPSQQDQQAWLTDRGAFRAELVSWRGKRWRCDDAEAAIEAARALGMQIDRVERTEDPAAKGRARQRVMVHGRPAGANAVEGPAGPDFTVRQLKQRESRSRPPAPFTTAAMQQAASIRLRFGTSRTMRVAQQLYEGVNVPGEGSVGLITYMRTDSRNLAPEAVSAVRSLIRETYGPDYVPAKPNWYASGERAQAAHEAIRPTDAARTPEELRGALSAEQFKLYELIWRQFVACQMPPAVWNVTEADILAATDAGEAVLRAVGRTLVFDGFLRVTGLPKSGEQVLPELREGQTVAPGDLRPSQHFTQPPPRYTEASLVKALEADNIGRPSTYAPIIRTIQDRNYVELLGRSFRPTDLGRVVTDKLVKHFPKVFDVRFTAHMEDELDRVEEDQADWVHVLREFYGPFKEQLETAREEMVHAKQETEPSDYTCSECGAPMVYRFGRNGRFLSCSRYPACKHALPVDRQGRPVEPERTDIACPKCGRAMTRRRGRYGPFLSCPAYPECDGVVNLDKKGGVKLPSPPPLEVELTCPKCGAPLYLRRGARGPWLSCSRFPKCRGRLGFAKLDAKQRADLEQRLAEHEKAHPQPTIRRLDGTAVEAGHVPQTAEPAAAAEAAGDGDSPENEE